MASAVYGVNTKIPTDGMSHDILRILIRASMK
jgi:hypothetical protein